MFARVKFAISWIKTLQLAAAGRLSDALALLDSVGPRFINDLEVQILRLSLLWQLEKFEAVIQTSEEVLSKIQTRKRIRPADKNYLHAFVWILRESAQAALRGLPHDTFDLDKLDWSQIDLDKVSRHLKLNYPLRTHPLWHGE